MRICLLSRNPTLYSGKRLVAAAKARGHGVIAVDYLRCSVDLTHDAPRVVYAGNPVDVDVVLPRIASGPETGHGAAIVRQFELAGVPCANSSGGTARAGDKLAALQVLAQAGIEMPRTAYAHASADKDLLIESVGGPPVVIKLLQGSQGQGVVLGQTRAEAESIIESFQRMGGNFLVQEFIAEAAGADLRAFVVDGKLVAAMQRTARAGDFRSNLHRGGVARKAGLTRKEREIALRAARALGLNIAGVDLVRSKRGPLVLEVNASPGLEGIETSTRADVAGTMIRFLEKLKRKTRP